MTLLGAESILHALPTCCHDLACSLAGLLVNLRSNSAGFRHHLAALAERSRWQTARVEAYRDRRLRVVKRYGYPSAHEQILLQETRMLVGSRTIIKIDYVERLPRSSSGKLRGVVSTIPGAWPLVPGP